jgi:hypothetical protein
MWQNETKAAWKYDLELKRQGLDKNREISAGGGPGGGRAKASLW